MSIDALLAQLRAASEHIGSADAMIMNIDPEVQDGIRNLAVAAAHLSGIVGQVPTSMVVDSYGAVSEAESALQQIVRSLENAQIKCRAAIQVIDEYAGRIS